MIERAHKDPNALEAAPRVSASFRASGFKCGFAGADRATWDPWHLAAMSRWPHGSVEQSIIV